MSVKRLAPSAVLAVGVTCLIGLGMTVNKSKRRSQRLKLFPLTATSPILTCLRLIRRIL